MRTRTARLVIGTALAIAGGGIAVAAAPALFAKIVPGLWELSGVEGSKTPIRACVANALELVQIEHRTSRCRHTLVKDGASSVTFTYQCTPGEFGRSKLDLVTARNVRVDTQGISRGLPFSYIVQARRMGDCNRKVLPVGH